MNLFVWRKHAHTLNDFQDRFSRLCLHTVLVCLDLQLLYLPLITPVRSQISKKNIDQNDLMCRFIQIRKGFSGINATVECPFQLRSFGTFGQVVFRLLRMDFSTSVNAFPKRFRLGTLLMGSLASKTKTNVAPQSSNEANPSRFSNHSLRFFWTCLLMKSENILRKGHFDHFSQASPSLGFSSCSQISDGFLF